MTQGRNSFHRQLKVFRRLVLVLFGLILLGAGMLLLGKMEDTVEGRGAVYGLREYELKSSVTSRITAIHHRTGDVVKKGTVLLELDDRDLQEELQKLRNTIRELEAEIEVDTWKLAVLRHDPLPKEYRHTAIELEEYRERVLKSGHEVEVFRGLRDKGVVSPLEFEQKELEFVKNKAGLKKLEDDLVKLQSGLAQKIISEAETGLELLRRRLESRRSELVMLEKHVADYRFVAPEDGTVGMIPTKTGIYVEPGQELVVLAASGPKKFIAYIDEKYIYKVREKQRVRIASSQYNYFEYGYFYGKVYAIDELPQPVGTRNCYAVRILLEESRYPLRLGSTGEAEIITGRDYIFRVLTGLTRPQQPAGDKRDAGK